MTKQMAGTRKEWLRRLELLKAEKELTHRGDELTWRPITEVRQVMSGHQDIG